MEEYKKPYLILWTSCTAAISALERQNFGLAREILLRAQQDAEEAYLADGRRPAPPDSPHGVLTKAPSGRPPAGDTGTK